MHRGCPQEAITFNGDEGIKIDRERCNNCGECTDTCYAEALTVRGQRISAENVVEEVMRDDSFYRLSKGGGLTLSGGEPLAQIGFAKEILKLAKENGITTAVETAGHYPVEVLQEADPFIDTYLYDIKHTDPIKHKKFTGADNRQILDNLEWLAKNKRNVTIRGPVIPSFNADKETLQSILDMANRLGIDQVNFLPYHEYGRTNTKRSVQIQIF
jgi:pyruvate formate lyase activating enzyme